MSEKSVKSNGKEKSRTESAKAPKRIASQDVIIRALNGKSMELEDLVKHAMTVSASEKKVQGQVTSAVLPNIRNHTLELNKKYLAH
jgi:hypothetical protein